MFGVPLSFAAPFVLGALVALPAIWLLLRVTPPQPRRIAFPPLRIIQDLLPRRETPARTPWWLLALRLAIAALLIMAAAGPVWNPAPAIDGASNAPVLLIVDNGFSAAHDWRERSAIALEQVDGLARDGRSLGIVATATPASEAPLLAPAAALEAIRAVQPQPHLADRGAALPAIERFLAQHPAASLVWISDGVRGAEAESFAARLGPLAKGRPVSILRADRAPALALAGAENAAAGLAVTLVRAEANGRDSGTLRAVDLKGLTVGELRYAFEPGATETNVRFDLPIELRNAIARVEILGEGSAGAVTLLDDRGRRKRIGIVSGVSVDQAQPLLAPTFYLTRALAPYADLREVRGGSAESVDRMLDEQVSVLILADVGALDAQTQSRVTEFVEKGGLLLRFAGSRLSAGNDELVPVRLRRGGRNIGGTLSWDTPRTFAPFPRESPFAGLPLPADLGVRRQILAEPDGELARKTWAALEDGTPIVTADRRGDGMIVLFHVTADANWSNLPLSGLFVDMLRRTVQFAGTPASAQAAAGDGGSQPVAPRQVLDGFGAMISPPATARPVTRDYDGRANAEHPPGFYGPIDSSLAVNALRPGDRLAPVSLAGLDARTFPLQRAETVDLRGSLFAAALALFLVDTLVSLWLSGHLAIFGRRLTRAGSAAALLLGLVLGGLQPTPVSAQAPPAAESARPPLTREALEGALATRLAYVITGDQTADATSKAGLTGLTQVLAGRTALEPGEPVGVDLARDELAFFPMLYWPVTPGRPLPGPDALRHLDTYMKNGGTVIFDTRDAMTARQGGAATPEAQHLRRMLATLDIPVLEPLPRDHVLTKTFYLLDTFPGRYDSGQTWVEAIPPAADEGEARPARAGDGVSPVVITGNDLAAAWAVGRRGEALYPVTGSDPRQREMAFRAGVNLVMYALTGNYKADQVHVPALLERLGN